MNPVRVVAVLAATAPVLTLSLVVPVSAPVAAEPGKGSRVAFTNDRDEVWEATFGRGHASLSAEVYPLEGTRRLEGAASEQHTGEMSSAGGLTTFVSTRNVDAHGEVFIERSRGDDEAVTCDNDAVETHPVPLQRGGRIAYASNIDGNWDIFVAEPDEENTDHVGGTCDGWAGTRVTTSPADDLWPAWTPDDAHLVFSSTRDDPLGDLYEVQPFVASPESTVRRITRGRGADTQPSVGRVQVSDDPPTAVDWIAFTSTRFRPDGSITMMPLDAAEQAAGPADPSGLAISPWARTRQYDDSPIQSSEAAWGNVASAPFLAFSSTAEDPYGDVWVGRIDLATVTEGVVEPRIGDRQPVASFPGVAESSPSWRAPVGLGERAASRLGAISYTTRAHDADVADVRSDGTDHRLVVQQPYDDAGPSYSPDGSRIVFSDAEVDNPARGLMTAEADGANPQPLDTSKEPSDTDVDPVWSPDGQRIAFVRYVDQGEGEYRRPQVMVLSLADGTVTPATREPTREPSADDTVFHDTDPSWSPDGKRLVVTRTEGPCCASPPERLVGPDLANSRGGLAYSRQYASHLVVIDPEGVDPDSYVATPRALCPALPCNPVRVVGRSPAWSPDGTTIAYSAEGGLRAVRLSRSGPGAGFWPTEGSPRQLTGIAPDGTPAPNRARIAWAEDPTWSPDGTEIAFAGQPAGQPEQRDLFAISSFDGTGLRAITRGRGPETEPAFAPPEPTDNPRRNADVSLTVSIAGSPASAGEPVTATFTVANHGPARATDVRLATTFSTGADAVAAGPSTGCDTDGSGCVFGALASGDTRAYVVTLRHAEPVSGVAQGQVTSTTPDPDRSNNLDRARYDVLGIPPDRAADVGVRARLDGRTGWVGGRRVLTVQVHTSRLGPARDVTLALTYPASPLRPESTRPCLDGAGPCILGTMAASATRTFRIPLTMLAEGHGAITVRVGTSTPDVDPANDTDGVSLVVLQPTIRLLPAVARPGSVAMAYGKDMPPGSRVTLRWAPGITVNGPTSFTVAGDGTVRAPLVLVRHDLLGSREVEARSVAGRFSPVRGPMLVTERLSTAPNLVSRG